MDLKSGYPFWLINDGLPFSYEKLDRDVETEVVILGGGISGALVRYYLVKAGISCIVVDARTIGLGSTCASTSLLQYEIDTPLHELISLVGKKNAERSYHLCNYAITELGKIAKKLKVDFEFKKSLYFAAHKKDLKSLKVEFAARQQAGFEVLYLKKEQIESDYGFTSPGGILSNHGGQTNAYALTHALFQYKKGEQFNTYDRSSIIKITHNKNNVELQTENGYTMKCKKLVYSTGFESIKYIDEKIVDLQSTYAVISEQYNVKKFWKDEVLLWNTADPYLYLRTTPDGRILVGGRDEPFYNPKKRDMLLKKKTKQLVNDVKKMFPNLDFTEEFNWTGTFGSTKDGLPYIGTYDKLPNSYFALGFGGNGITFSLIAAEIITDLIQGKENKDAQIFSFDRTNNPLS
ncbi:FAD-binding oxidoreductase [Flavobacterium sp. GT3R68]|uniref:NAD(P)/FAD-dependent oxidoreductase n=1 Tax=Flavobacterium sp. GT3R68 TaxID=2594437 RepID=UPI000F86DEE6|nr:FAD-binding oxidoreductase [Flavobacterium sp. GT3R68]RTY95164.1 FAD-binding oxidoreductase [Flavobacterium sp. GSN2]TRW91094.1 FAD-binding oxidoreductase [Flavobacterium sp. GT3R68]